MAENLPSFIDDVPTKPDPKPARSYVLPPYSLNLFKNQVLNLGISEYCADRINIWWRTVDRTNEWVQRANLPLETVNLPKQERKDAREVLSTVKPTFDDINTSLNQLLVARIPKIKQLLKITPKEDSIASDLTDKIDKFNTKLKTPHTDQAIAFCEAYHETFDLNDTRTMRMKIAQWAFEEMVNLFPHRKIWYQYEIGTDPTTIDDLENEKNELIAALRGDVWTPTETKKWQKIFEKNRKIMDKLEFVTETKLGFNFIFKCALGEVSQKNSAISILNKVEQVWQDIGEDDTLQEVWDYELEKDEEE